MTTPATFQSALRETGGILLEGRRPAPCCCVTPRYHLAHVCALARGAGAIRRAGAAGFRGEAFNTAVRVLNVMLRFGGSLHAAGFDRARECFDRPAVYVSNHMGAVETYLLPGILLGLGNMSVVVKTSLLKFPFIGPILRASQPIALGRQDARRDLLQILGEGQALLRGGRAIVLFPQGTRRHPFEARRFNSLGEKLSARAGVPLVPVAVDTRFQALGKILPDFGAVRPRFTIRVECGEPIPPGLPARERHARSISFIRERLLAWGVPVVEETVHGDMHPPTPNPKDSL